MKALLEVEVIGDFEEPLSNDSKKTNVTKNSN